MIYKLIFFFLAASYPLYAQNQVPQTRENEQLTPTQPLKLSSDKACGNQKEIQLSGNVSVHHVSGTLQAEEARLITATDKEANNPGESSSRNKKKRKIAFLHLQNNVSVHLTDGGSLTASKAELDCATLTGTFYSNDTLPFVTYKETSPETRIPLEVKSRLMRLQMDANSNQGLTVVKEINTFDDVSVTYDKDFFFTADKGTYVQSCNTQSSSSSSGKLSGNISLSMHTPEGFCQARHSKGDWICAKTMIIANGKREIVFTAPYGAIRTSYADLHEEKITFTASSLLWANSRDLLTLTGDVNIEQQGLRQWQTNDKAHIYCRQKEGRRQLSVIESFGNTTLTHINSSKQQLHQINCYDKVSLDHENCCVTMSSPQASDGLIPKEKQVFFHDKKGEIRADSLKMHYSQINDKCIMTKLHLEGNVSLFDYKASDTLTSNDFLHYAIADRVTYTPASEELYLEAYKNKRVLFYDKINNLQISAPALKIKRDSITQKESIKGIGDVRMSFIESELQQLKERFELIQ